VRGRRRTWAAAAPPCGDRRRVRSGRRADRPFAKIFEALDAGEIDAALLIHEGRLSWKDDPTLHQVVEIGEAWTKLTAGCRCRSAATRFAATSATRSFVACPTRVRRSIVWALAHRDEVLDAILTSGARDEAKVYARAPRSLLGHVRERPIRPGISSEVVRANRRSAPDAAKRPDSCRRAPSSSLRDIAARGASHAGHFTAGAYTVGLAPSRI